MTEEEWFYAGPVMLLQHLRTVPLPLRKYRLWCAAVAAQAWRFDPQVQALYMAWSNGMSDLKEAFSSPQSIAEYLADIPFAACDIDRKADLLRCIFGNPWLQVPMCHRCAGDGKAHGADRPFAGPAVCPVCGGNGCYRFSSAAVQLAESMYTSRDFSMLPLLADILEESGCTYTALLAHCRGGGPHARGCWAVDVVKGTHHEKA